MIFKIIFGTRPEIIKCSSFIFQARKRGHQVQVIFTGQHESLARPMLELFEIDPDVSFSVMSPNQNLATLSMALLEQLNKHALSLPKEDYVVVQGDTTTAAMGAYWAFCHKKKIIHLEAGLRTYDTNSPYPEELNRQIIARMADIHLVPTEDAKKRIRDEKVNYLNKCVIGNTAIDALRHSLHLIEDRKITLEDHLGKELADFIGNKKLVLITSHRRESYGQGFLNLANAFTSLALKNPEVSFVFPVHLNPNVKDIMYEKLSNIPNLKLVAPLDYLSFVLLMRRANLIMTDSGGVQEEAPFFGKPVLVLRENTERMEVVKTGHCILVGTDPNKIIEKASYFLSHEYKNENENPYGDGHAAEKAFDYLESL